MAPWFANPNDNPDPEDSSNEANKTPSFWDRRQNKTRDSRNPDIDAETPANNGGNSSWWHKPDSSNKNKRKN